MIERDYIMRMINMLVAAIVRVLALKDKKEYPQALQELQSTGKALLGIDRTLVDQFSVDQLMQLFGADLSVAVPKSYVLGVLLKEEAEIYALMSDDARAGALFLKSLDLLIETYLRFDEPVESRHLEHIDGLLENLGLASIPAGLLKKIFRYQEALHRFAKAENALYAVLDSEPAFAQEGIQFYRRLLKKTDEELAAGNLPRDEVLEGLSELK
jgi:hypothetical protein